MRLIWARCHVTGLRWRDIPEGPVILVANHVNWIDPVVIGISCPYQISMFGKEELFHIPILKNLIRRWHAIPVRRGGADREALRRAIRTVSSGRILGIFPEGKRSAEGELQKGLSGAAFIALQTGAMIVPIGISGTRGIRAKPHPFHLGYITINIGQPFQLSRTNTDNLKDELQQHTDLIMHRIAELLPEDARGIYADGSNSRTSPASLNGRQELAG